MCHYSRLLLLAIIGKNLTLYSVQAAPQSCQRQRPAHVCPLSSMPLSKSSQSGLLLLTKMSRNRPERYTPKPPPAFSFVTITNPKESKTQSKKRAVRSHVAYYQHHKNDDEKDDIDISFRSRKHSRRVVKAEDSLSSDSSLESINFQILQSGASIAGSEVGSGSSPITPTFSGTRVDQFQSYPVPWKQHYDPILDFCKLSGIDKRLFLIPSRILKRLLMLRRLYLHSHRYPRLKPGRRDVPPENCLVPIHHEEPNHFLCRIGICRFNILQTIIISSKPT